MQTNTEKHTKHFIIQRSELERRWDPEMVLYQRRTVDEYEYPTKKISQLLKSNPQYGANESGIDRFSDDIPRYIRITDIEEDGTLKNDFGKTAKKIESKYFLNNNDVLFARSGNTVGKSYIHKKHLYDYECFFAGYMIRFVFDINQILPDYAFIFTQTKFYKEWVKATQRTAGQPNINAEEYKSLKLPLPELLSQQEIVRIYQTAYKAKQQKEQEVKQLLDSIDTYLLNELGITIPEKDNSLESRMFTVNFSEVSGDRIDPDYQFYSYLKIEGGKYDNFRLREIAKVVKGQSITSSSIIEGEYPVIAGGQSSPYSHNIYNYNGNIITISASGAYSGFVWYHDYPIFASDCSVIWSKNEKSISTYFLSELMKLKQAEIYKLQQGAGQPHVYASDLVKMNIPVPPPNKQTEIANHISNIRQRAVQLQQEAEEVLNQAKSAIEKMILNDTQRPT